MYVSGLVVVISGAQVRSLFGRLDGGTVANPTVVVALYIENGGGGGAGSCFESKMWHHGLLVKL